MQQKLQQIQKTGQYADRGKAVFGEGSAMSKESQKIFANQQSEDLKYLREKFNNLQRLKQNQDKMVQDNAKALISEKLLEVEKTRILKEQVQLKERMTAIQRDQINIAERAKGIDPSLSGFKGAGGGPPGPNQPRPYNGEMPWEYSKANGPLDFSGVNGKGGDMTSTVIKAIGVGKIAQMIAAGIQGSANFAASTFFEYGQNISRQQAGTIGGAARASGIEALTNGRGIEIPYYARERQTALDNAQAALGGLSARGVGGMLASTVAGAGTGAGIGLAAGSLALNPFTAAGGAAIGGTIGGIAGLGKSLFSGQTGAGISSFVRGEGYGAGVDQYRASYLAENFEQNMKAEQEKSYFKTKSLNYLEQNRPQMVNAQQISGLGDSGLFDYLGAGGGSFTTADKFGAMSGIAGAGGSTGQIRRATDALNLKRDYGIQNAAGILGGLSGNIGGGRGGADEVTKKILADAFSVGLDASNFSRETEKFVTMSAKFVEDSGARSPEAMKAVAAEMSSFVAGNSQQEIGSAGFGREYLENKLGAGGGEYQKSLQLSSLRRNKQLQGLDSSQLISLTNMSPDQIKAGGMEVESMAMKTGMSVEDFQKQAMNAKQFAMTPFASTEKKMNQIKGLAQQLGVNPANADEMNAAIANEQDPERKKQLEQLKMQSGSFMSEMTTYDSTFAGKKDSDKRAVLSGMLGFNETRTAGDQMPMRGETGMEQGEKAQARSEQIMLQKSQESFGDYVSSANKAQKATMEMVEAFETFVNAVTSKSKDLETYAQRMLDAQGQPQRKYNAPRPSNGR